jgi:hypothetical protein
MDNLRCGFRRIPNNLEKARNQIGRALTNPGKNSKMLFYGLGKLRKMGNKQLRLVTVPPKKKNDVYVDTTFYCSWLSAQPDDRSSHLVTGVRRLQF